ncbi:MAG: hypothetical protein AAB217_22045, partial [Chloroflexota bacterium]
FRIVGGFYLLLGVMNVVFDIIDPQLVAAGSLPASYTPDEVTVKALVHTFLPSSLAFVVLGALLLYYSRQPARAGILVLTIALLELLTWVPYNVIWFMIGLPVAPAIPFLIIHLLIGITGVLFLQHASAKAAELLKA